MNYKIQLTDKRGSYYQDVSGEPVGAFLAIRQVHNEVGQGWNVDHVPSGCKLAPPFDTKENAIEFANVLINVFGERLGYNSSESMLENSNSDQQLTKFIISELYKFNSVIGIQEFKLAVERAKVYAKSGKNS